MEPVIIAFICAASLSGILTLSLFIRQLFLSRDKQFNDQALNHALAFEAAQLSKIRNQMQKNQRFKTQHQLLNTQKAAITQLDNTIADLIEKKTQLIERYAEASLKVSSNYLNDANKKSNKLTLINNSELKQEVKKELAFYDQELEIYQKRRSDLWASMQNQQSILLAQEKARNEKLDALYHRHTGVLEKIYLRHLESNDRMNTQSIEAGNLSLKDALMGPIQALAQFFLPASGVAAQAPTLATAARLAVAQIEEEFNTVDNKTEDLENDGDDSNESDAETQQNETIIHL